MLLVNEGGKTGRLLNGVIASIWSAFLLGGWCTTPDYHGRLISKSPPPLPPIVIRSRVMRYSPTHSFFLDGFRGWLAKPSLVDCNAALVFLEDNPPCNRA